jgi:hypothetical protein
MKEIKLNLVSVEVQSKVNKTEWKHVIGKPYYDIHPDAAKALGTTRKEYRKLMNK